MPNTFAAAGISQLANAMVAGLYAKGVLVNTIYRDAETDLVVGKGNIVTIREPVPITAANFTGTAAVTAYTEGKIAVTIDQEPYSQVEITPKEKTLLIEDLVAQVIIPQAAGVIEYIEDSIATKLETSTGTATGATWSAAIASASATLTSSGVPQGGRFLAVAPDVLGELLTTDVVIAPPRTDAAQSLDEALIGRLYGFDVVVSPYLTAGNALAYHSTSVAGVFRLPVPPEGGAIASSASLNGFTAQAIYAYNPAKLSDSLTVHTLYGLGTSTVSFNDRALVVTVTP